MHVSVFNIIIFFLPFLPQFQTPNTFSSLRMRSVGQYNHLVIQIKSAIQKGSGWLFIIRVIGHQIMCIDNSESGLINYRLFRGKWRTEFDRLQIVNQSLVNRLVISSSGIIRIRVHVYVYQCNTRASSTYVRIFSLLITHSQMRALEYFRFSVWHRHQCWLMSEQTTTTYWDYTVSFVNKVIFFLPAGSYAINHFKPAIKTI